MSNGILITFLGANRPSEEKLIEKDDIEQDMYGYGSTNYYCEEKNNFVDSKFTYEWYLARHKERVNHVFLVGSINSSWEEVYRYYSIKLQCFEFEKYLELRKEIVGSRNFDKLRKEEIEKLLKKYYNQFYHQNIDFHIILIEPELKKEQINKTFNCIKDEILTSVKEIEESFKSKEESYLVCDVTNGFRSIPIYTYMLSNYLKYVRGWKSQFQTIYGMFEAKQNNYTPIADLASVDQLLSWINAANEFRSYGSVRTLLRLLKKEEREEVKDLIKVFEQFEFGTNRNDLFYLHKSVLGLSDLVTDSIPNTAIQLIMSRISLDLKEHFKKTRAISTSEIGSQVKQIVYFQVELAMWYKKQGQIGLSAITMQEALTTVAMWLGNQDIAPSELFYYKWRDYFRKTVLLQGVLKEISLGEISARVSNSIRNIVSHCNYAQHEEDKLANKISEQEEMLENFQKELIDILKNPCNMQKRISTKLVELSKKNFPGINKKKNNKFIDLYGSKHNGGEKDDK